ncbi:hypothetical protein HPB50_028264 [Hyalomma asiaticum]|nr:hypothetical protein HPB50_028264 [Hyalomma asiaticum]
MLLSFLEQYPSLAQRSFSATRYFTAADRRRLWREITEALNAEGPIRKTSEQWQLWWRKHVCGAARLHSRGGGAKLYLRSNLPDVAAAVEVATMPAPQPPRRPVRRPRPPRADVLTAMATQCCRTLDQGTNMLVVAGPLCIRKFRA